MTISYAGVHLPSPLPEQLARIEAVLDPQTLHDAERSLWPGAAGSQAFWPYLDSRMRPVRVGTLSWPVGASRWAVGRFLADSGSLGLIQQTVYGGSSGYQAATLHLDDGTDRGAIETSLYMLPPRPIFQVDLMKQLWLLTLVDDRWFWWQRSGEVTVDEGTTTWEDVYDQIGTLLGVTITAEAVAAAYDVPSDAVASRYSALPPFLDAVAAEVGQRIVRALDGTVRAVSAATEKTKVEVNLLSVGPTSAWPNHAGGLFALHQP